MALTSAGAHRGQVQGGYWGRSPEHEAPRSRVQAAHFPKVILDSHQSTMTPVSAGVVTRRDDEYDAPRGSRRALPDVGERAWRERRGDAVLHRVGGAAGPVGGQGRGGPGAVRDGGRE